MSDPADLGLRASDADREATAQRLHTAATEGRLDAEELDERLTAVYAATLLLRARAAHGGRHAGARARAAGAAAVRPPGADDERVRDRRRWSSRWSGSRGSARSSPSSSATSRSSQIERLRGPAARQGARDRRSGARLPRACSCSPPCRRQHVLSGTGDLHCPGAHDLDEPVQEREPHRGGGHGLQDPRVPARQARQGRRLRAHQAAPHRRRRGDRPDVPGGREVPGRPDRGAQDAVPLRRRHRRPLHGRAVVRAARAPRGVARGAR